MQEKITHTSHSLDDTRKIAETFLKNLKPQQTATLIGLYGDLGSGKTTFTQAAAKLLDVTETVTSPTFVIEKIYKLSHQHFTHLIHIDAYRLESGKELLSLGWQEIMNDPKNLIFLEWPEKVSDILPETIQKIEFLFVDETTRSITFLN
jgi:tRNA threonylcarbamoyladenosine biosynthesis protein TsaE